ncbi:rolling circle replication-associated protein [Frisingicoccus sp.]|uniref:rolling circle replication-associated protein n=1 Tax=Frisingicoccus sp. TaxID=1918627 RepID=UPI0025BA8112|nr:hypothetical protein [Frisingicoccus sp.]
MAYWKDVFEFTDSNEYEYKFAGNYGAKGEKRAKRKKPTPEQIRKQNQINREKYVRRLIKKNFRPYDIWACLKYPKGIRKKLEEVKKDFRDFIRTMQRRYRKVGEVFKYIYRMEIGEKGGIHIHILVNRLRGQVNTDVIMQEVWGHGVVDYKSIYAEGGYEKLAEYIVKKPEEDGDAYKQLSLLPEEEQGKYLSYNCSRNLIRPKAKRKEYRHWNMRKILKDGPKPRKGYYIDKNSIVSGVNAFTGMSYLHYTEYRIDTKKDSWQQDDGGGG